MKRTATILLALAICVGLCITACAEPKSATATASGFGGEVRVTVTVEDGVLQDVVVLADGETAGIGSNAVEQMPGKMIEAGTVDVDGISGCTVTSTAILTAAKAAYAQTQGNASDDTMKPGVYTAQAFGHSTAKPLTVEVTLGEHSIESIVVTDGYFETAPILASVQERLIPRMIEANSVAVDAITGATESSTAVKTAVADCIAQALKANGNEASAVTAYMTAPEPSDAQEELSYDVVVVGLGGSGTAAALRAAETQQAQGQPVSVLGIEKAGKYGGTVAVTAEMLAVNPKEFAAENNEGKDYVDVEAMLDAWMAYTMGDADEALVRLDLENSGDALDWMRSHGWAFAQPVTGFSPEDIWQSKYMYLPNNNYGNREAIATYFDGMFDDYTALGGDYMLEVEATELLYDADSAAVTGVIARGYDGTTYTIHAKSVVLATGGFGENDEMTETYLSDTYYPLKGAWAIHGLGTNDGKMIEAALEIGAGTKNIDNPPVTHLAGPARFYNQFEKTESDDINFFTGKKTVWTQGDLTLALCIAPDGLAVTKDGVRYTNEYMLDHFDTWKAGPYYYTIWSDTQLAAIRDQGIDWMADGPSFGWLGCQCPIPANVPLTQTDEIVATAVQDGIMWEADSIEALAEAIGMDAATLAQTVEAYNGYVDAGVDPQFGKDAKFLDAKVEGERYYAIKALSYSYTIGGGLDVNTQLQVLDTNGAVIDGLYAVGTDSECALYSPQKAYVTYGGSAAGWAWTSGYLGGKSAVMNMAK